MIKNLLKTAFHFFWRQKTHSFINIIGLSIGLAICITIFLYVDYQKSFDKYHKNPNQIYRIVREFKNTRGTHQSPITPYPLIPFIKSGISGIEKSARVIYKTRQVTYKKEVFKIKNILFTSPEIGEILNIPLISGNLKELSNPNKAFIKEDIAKTIFGKENPIGKNIELGDDLKITIAGVLKSHKQTTHMPYKMLISEISFKDIPAPIDYDSWGMTSSGFYSYVRIGKKANPEEISENISNKIWELVKKNNDERSKTKYILQPLREIHYDEKFGRENQIPFANITHIIIIGIIGLFILILASINFINLSITQLLKRKKEIGIRKVNGANRKNITLQMFFETSLIISTATIFSILISEVLLSHINTILGEHIKLQLYQNQNIFIFILILIICVTGITGVLPAIIFSKQKPTHIIKENKNPQKSVTFRLRNLLIIFQFTISIALITSTLIIRKQIKYIQEKDLGFKTKNIINLEIPKNEKATTSLIKERLKRVKDIENLTFCIGPPATTNNVGSSYHHPDMAEKEYIKINIKCVDHNYQKTFGLEIIAGKWWRNKQNRRDTNQTIFQKEPQNKTTTEVVVNQTFAHKIGYKNLNKLIGEKIKIAGLNGIIIGVVKDFHLYSLHQKTKPVAFIDISDLFFGVSIQLKKNFQKESINKIMEIWQETFPKNISKYEFIEDTLKDMYKEDNRTLTLIKIASWISIIIASLGLLGISMHTVSRKTKEISIRKVLGSKNFHIIYLISKPYLTLIFIANLIAFPIAHTFAKKWLENFFYRVEIGPFEFLITLIFSFAISFGIISFHILKTSRKNPSNTLRYE